jgi:hypothetical protein
MRPGVKLTTYLPLMPRLRIRGAILLLPAYTFMSWTEKNLTITCMTRLNLLAPEFGIKILAHTVCKMWIIQEPKQVALWNERHFEEEKNGDYAACLKNSVRIYVLKKYIKWGVWRVAVCPSYIYDARFLKVNYRMQELNELILNAASNPQSKV